MTENEKRPEKIDLDELLGESTADERGSDSDEIQLLDPVTGEPLSRRRGTEATPVPDAAEGVAEEEHFRDLYLRTRAEFENYRKRIERERGDERARAAAGLVEDLLPVLDSLERALAGAPEGEPFRDGVALIHRQMQETLAKAGLRPIEALGEMFDPAYHHAVATERRDDFEPNRVIDVIQQGYMFKDRVLRPALVRVVASGGQAPGQGGETDT